MPKPSRHSDIVGGSTAARVVNCPGSIAILATLPKEVNVTSEWAEEGSDLHSLISVMIDSDGATWPVPGETLVNDTLITAELFHDCLAPCWDFWQSLRPHLDEVAVEVEAEFPGVPGAFGTSDLCGRSEALNTTYLVDWKMGAGHSVAALYPDPEDERYMLINEQLLFYACCLRKEYPDWFPAGVKIELYIVQPRNQDPDLRQSSVVVGNEDLDAFEQEVQQALKEATRPEAAMLIGPWCKFAACKPQCPLHNAPLLDLVAIEAAALPVDSKHPEALARILDLAPVAEALIAEARKQALDLMQAGRRIPGWKLVAKGTKRRWNQDEAVTIKLLRKHFRLKKADVTESVVKSPAQIEKLLPKGKTIPPELAAAPLGVPTIAPDSDKRPAVTPPHEDLRDILKLALAHESQDG